MFYTIYKVTNKVNGKIYIGKHQTDNVNDKYYGSGKAIKEAIQKYGINNFVKEILFVFDNEHDMNLKEKEIITEEFVNRNDTYNLGIGGEGGPHFKRKSHSPETIEKLKTHRVKRTVSVETKNKLSEANRGRIVTQHTRNKISQKAKERYKNKEFLESFKEKARNRPKRTLSDETRKKIADGVKKRIRLRQEGRDG